MRKLFLLTGVLVLAFLLIFQARANSRKWKYNANDSTIFKSGDIIFQTTLGGQSTAIMLATHSKFTHVGLVFYENNTPYVYEAVQPVRKTPLAEWIRHGVDGHYVVKRLNKSDSVLTSNNLNKIKANFYSFINKDYDLYFGWSDEKLYCSELVWKLYKNNTGIELGKLQKLKEFDLKSQVVKNKLKERYGDKIPYEELVISPQAIFECNKLNTVIVK
jgi:uncharacterized protein YycO